MNGIEVLVSIYSREVAEETGIAVEPQGVVFVREWIVPRFAKPVEHDERSGYGIEVGVWATAVHAGATPRVEEIPNARVPKWVSFDDVADLPVWPVELRTLVAHIAAGTTVSFVPSIIGRLQPPTDHSPPIRFSLNAEGGRF